MISKARALVQLYLFVVLYLSVSLDAFSPKKYGEKRTLISLKSRNSIKWEVYVDQSEVAVSSGSTATLDAFIGLVPRTVKVNSCIITTSSRSKSPIVRCLSRIDPNKNLEVTNVDSVDKVYRLLTYHMKVQGVDANARECIKWKHKGNSYLDRKKIKLAIEAYDNALKLDCKQEEANILLKRAFAYQQRASSHKKELKKLVLEFTSSVVSTRKIMKLYEVASENLILAPQILKSIESYSNVQDANFERVKFRDGLYQNAILHAVQDALRATQLIPYSERSWLTAAQLLSEFLKPTESIQYYERAVDLDPFLTEGVKPEISRLQKIQELLDNTKSQGWSKDILRWIL